MIITRHHLSVPDLGAFIEYTEEEERILNKEKMQAQGGPAKRESVNSDWDEVFFGFDLTTVEGVSGAHNASRNVSFFHNLDEFFREAFRRVSVGMESSFLGCVENCPDFNLYHFRSLLEQLPENWKKRQSVKHGLTSMTKAFCRRYCMDIVRNQYYEPLPFDLVRELTDIDDSEFIGSGLGCHWGVSGFGRFQQTLFVGWSAKVEPESRGSACEPHVWIESFRTYFGGQGWGRPVVG